MKGKESHASRSRRLFKSVVSLHRLITTVVLAGAASTIAFAVPGAASASATSSVPASSVRPVPASSALAGATVEGCINTLRIDPPQICFEINGTGRYVDWFGVYVGSGYAIGKFEVFGPSGKWWSGVVNVEGGKWHFFNIYRYLTAGKYCGTYWNKNPNGTFTNKGSACLSVHA